MGSSNSKFMAGWMKNAQFSRDFNIVRWFYRCYGCAWLYLAFSKHENHFIFRAVFFVEIGHMCTVDASVMGIVLFLKYGRADSRIL